MRPAHLIKVLEREFLSATEGLHTPVMLWGPPGVGKSQIVQQIACSHGADVIDVRLSQMEPSAFDHSESRDAKVIWRCG